MRKAILLISLALALAAAPALAANTTWNPSDKSASVTLGNWSGQANLYAEQSSAASTYAMVRSTTSHSTGKFYFEVITPLVDTGNQGNLIGVANSTQTLSNFVGSTNNSLGFKSGSVFLNGVTVTGTACTITNLIPIGFAVDLTNNKMWCTTNGSTWSNCSACATGDPTVAATGYNISTVNTGNVFIAWSGQDNANADNAILNVGNYGPFQFSIPSGYSGWDAGGTTLVNAAGTGSFIAAGSGAYDSSGSTATLTNSNLTAARSAGNPITAIGDWNDIKTTGKRYFEVHLDSGTIQDLGIVSPILPGTAQAGVDSYGWGYVFSVSDGSGYSGNTKIYTVTTHQCIIAAYAGIAVDFTNNKMWCTLDGSTWTNGDNPATNTGGMSLTATHLGYGSVLGLSWQTVSGQGTVNVGATSFHFSPPSGFVAWDSAASGAIPGTLMLMGIGD